MAYLFSSESVSEGHPDKVADQISDALLDQFLAYDDHAHCAIETFCTTGQMKKMLDFKHFLSRKTGVQLFGSSDRLYSRFFFLIKLFEQGYKLYLS